MGGVAGLSRVELGMEIGASDAGFSGVVTDAMEQIAALKTEWEGLAEAADPFAAWAAQLTGLVTTAEGEVARLKETLASIGGESESLRITADVSGAEASLANLEAQAARDFSAMETSASASFTKMESDTADATDAMAAAADESFTKMQQEAESAASAIVSAMQGAAEASNAAIGGLNGQAAFDALQANAQSASQSMEQAVAGGASEAAASLGEITSAAAQVEQSVEADFSAMAQGVESTVSAMAQSVDAQLQAVVQEIEAVKSQIGGFSLPAPGPVVTPTEPGGGGATLGEEGAAAAGGASLGKLAGAAGVGIMAAMGVGALVNSGQSAVALQMLLQQNRGMTPQQGEQLLAELGTVGLSPDESFTLLSGLEKGLVSSFTVTGSSGLSKAVLLAMSQAGVNVAPGETGQDAMKQLENLGLEPQLQTMAALYANATQSGGANMASIQTLLGGMGASGEQLQMLLANYSSIQQQTAGVGKGLTTADVDKMAQQGLSEGAAMAQLNLEIMQLATVAAPELGAAFKGIEVALQGVKLILETLNAAGNGIKDLADFMGTMSGADAAMHDFIGIVEEGAGSLATLLGHVPGLHFAGGVGADLTNAGRANLAEAAFMREMVGEYGAKMTGPAGAPMHVPVPTNINVSVTLPANASADMRDFAEQTAQAIVQQFKLSSNMDFIG